MQRQGVLPAVKGVCLPERILSRNDAERSLAGALQGGQCAQRQERQHQAGQVRVLQELAQGGTLAVQHQGCPGTKMVSCWGGVRLACMPLNECAR